MPPGCLPLPPVASLVATAEARMRRQRGYARPLAGRVGPARRLEAALLDARAVLGRVAPAAAWREVSAVHPGHDGVDLDGVGLQTPRLAAELRAGATVGVWLCTLGPLPPRAEATGEDIAPAVPVGQDGTAGFPPGAPGHGTGDPDVDPLARHVLKDLAQQTLYAAARAAHGALAARYPGRRVLRVPLRRPGERLWDAGAVLALLPLLGPAPLGVTAPDGVALWPPHSLLGIAVVRPRSAGHGAPPPASG